MPGRLCMMPAAGRGTGSSSRKACRSFLIAAIREPAPLSWPPAPTAPQPTPGRPAFPPTLGAVCQRLARPHAGLLRRGYRQALLIQLSSQPLQVKLCMERGWSEWRRGGGGTSGSSSGGGAGARSHDLACLLIASQSTHPSSRPAPRWAAPLAPPGRRSGRPAPGASCGNARRPPWRRSFSPRG